MPRERSQPEGSDIGTHRETKDAGLAQCCREGTTKLLGIQREKEGTDRGGCEQGAHDHAWHADGGAPCGKFLLDHENVASRRGTLAKLGELASRRSSTRGHTPLDHHPCRSGMSLESKGDGEGTARATHERRLQCGLSARGRVPLQRDSH